MGEGRVTLRSTSIVLARLNAVGRARLLREYNAAQKGAADALAAELDVAHYLARAFQNVIGVG